jgi:uncharacterized protein (TIGR00661 family)
VLQYTSTAGAMANILYGVNGEGAGHSTRAKEVIMHLISRGHAVHVASFDRGLRNLSEDFEVTEIYGFRLAYVNNRVRYRRTVLKNLISVGQAAKSAKRLGEIADASQIEIVITDFEPLTCHIANRKKLPLISIDNQHCLTNTKITYPKQCRRDAAAAKIVTRAMVPQADAYLVTSFFAAPIKKPRTFLFAPILRNQVLRATPTEADHVLVYVTSPAPQLATVLSSIRGKFVAYGFGREGQEANVLYKKPAMEAFLQDLSSAKAVIANAGFSLLSEALHLGKPYLAIPVKHQFEQIFNAYWLEKMGYGAYWEELNKERIESFRYNLPQFRERLADYPKQGNARLLQTLDSLISEFTSSRAASVGQ